MDDDFLNKTIEEASIEEMDRMIEQALFGHGGRGLPENFEIVPTGCSGIWRTSNKPKLTSQEVINLCDYFITGKRS